MPLLPETLQEAIALIEQYDDYCSCNIIKSCDTCPSHTQRVSLLEALKFYLPEKEQS